MVDSIAPVNGATNADVDPQAATFDALLSEAIVNAAVVGMQALLPQLQEALKEVEAE